MDIDALVEELMLMRAGREDRYKVVEETPYHPQKKVDPLLVMFTSLVLACSVKSAQLFAHL